MKMHYLRFTFHLVKAVLALLVKVGAAMSTTLFQLGFALMHPRELLAAIEAQSWTFQAALALIALMVVYGAVGHLA